MAAKQRMRLANEEYNKNITARGNVPKSLVSLPTLRFTISQTYRYLVFEYTKLIYFLSERQR